MNKENVSVSCRKERVPSDKTKLILPTEHPKEWEEVVQPLISSNVWLQKHGLGKKKLTLNQILSTIGFKVHEKTDETVEKPAVSHYGRAILSKVLKSNGKAFNISCSRDKLYHLEKQLLQAIYLFKRRIEWLTTESRRMFGVIEEDSVTIVLDYDSISQQPFDQYKTALENVLRQQVSKLSKFNLIRACEDLQLFSSVCVPVSHNNIENAVDWIWNLDGQTSVSSTACAEALLKALSDNQNEAVYLFTEGSSINKAKKMLTQEVCSKENTIPVHVVSFNCDCSNTIKYLREFAELANGRFHAYGVVVATDAYELPPVDGATNIANVMHKCKIQGGVPAGAGVRKDVVLVFEEMEEARSILEQVQILAEIYPTLSVSTKDEEITPDSIPSSMKEKYVDSKEWLKSNGLEANGLGWHEILSVLAFRHADGVVDLMHPAEEIARDAIVEQKLVNARYCDELFPVVKLNDGEIFHVLVTPDIYRKCKEKIQGVLNKIQKRIDWLNKGSRSLFGTLVEDQVYILIDISASMQPSLNFVKQKLFILMQEQLRHKKKFNIVAFNTKIVAWKDRIVDVSEQSMQSAWSWVKSLSCWGSTNTNAAIQMALADPGSQAIYLLTDGRPDQPPSSIISGVQMQNNIPIHTISFNCNDAEANRFLYDLAETTGGRFHCYSEKGQPLSQPKAWESMDIKDLKTEINIGLENLKELLRLRDESSRLVWKRGADDLKKSFNSSSGIENSFSSVKKISGSLRVTRNTNKHSMVHSLHRRPVSAPSNIAAAAVLSRNPVPPFDQPVTVQRQRRLRHRNQECGSFQGSNSAEVSYLGQRKAYPYHTRTGSGRFTPSEWMLSETKVLFQKQANKQEDTTGNPAYSTRLHKHPVHSCLEVQKTADSFVGQEKNLTTKEWLSRHSLAAKHLTIMDALGTTCVSHKTKYVKILDKFISGKVFEEIMPMAFVSEGNRMHFVNPNGVDLRAYERKVRAAMGTLKKYLDLSVWEALPQSAKQEFDSNKPVSFEKNRTKILMLLKEADWSMAEEDIANLEEEIEKGKKYIKQSRALRKASGEEIDDEDTESSSIGTSRSSSVSRSVSSDVSTKGSRKRSAIRKSRSRSRSHSSNSGHSKGPKSGASPESPKGNVSSQNKDPSRSLPVSSTDHHSVNHDRSRKHKKQHAPVLQKKYSARSRSQSSSEHHSKDSLIRRFKKIALSSQTQKKIDKSRSVPLSRHWSQSRQRDGSRANKTTVRSRSHPLTKGDKSPSVASITLTSSVKNKQKLKLLEQTEKWLKTHKHEIKETKEVSSSHKEKSKCDGSSTTIKGKVLVKFTAMKGQKVIARRNENGLYYKGTVFHCPDPEHCVVSFEDGEKSVFTWCVLPHGGAISCPPLFIGDYALIKVIQPKTMLECFVPCVIQGLPQSYSEQKLYTVVMYNGQKAKAKRGCLVKISRDRFIDDCVYIASIENEHSTEIQAISSRTGRQRSQIQRPDDRIKHVRPSIADGDVNKMFSRSQSSSSESNSENSSQDNQESINTSVSTSHSRSSSRSSKKMTSPTSSRSSSRSSSRERKHRRLSKSEDKQLSPVQKQIEKQDEKIQSFRKKTVSISMELNQQKNVKIAEETPVLPAQRNKKDKPVSSWLLELRGRLQEETPLITGERVLARWSDDGWYYRGTVRDNYSDCSYEIEDSSGFTERIWREDIFSENQVQKTNLKVDNCVIALHPKYNLSYAPGVIKETTEKEVLVKFYNSHGSSAEHYIAVHDVYFIPHDKYKHDVKYIRKKEDELVQSDVVARCDEEGAYFPGTVMSKGGDSNMYNIQWANGTRSKQEVIHIFGGFTRRPKIQLHSHVLACADPVLLKFLPGLVTRCQENALSVKFCDGMRLDDVNPDNCFWLGEDYYNEAVRFCSQFQP